MENLNIEMDAQKYLNDLKIAHPNEYGEMMKEDKKDLMGSINQKEREKTQTQQLLKEEEAKIQNLNYDCKNIQLEIIKIQKEIYWMETQATKEKKNQQQLDIILQEELHHYLLSKKYERIKKYFSWTRVRGQKKSGPCAALVILFLENPLNLTQNNQKMPYLVHSL